MLRLGQSTIAVLASAELDRVGAHFIEIRNVRELSIVA